jgi:hypothetical protein
VEPLDLRVGLPPQATFTGNVPVVALPPLALWLPPHADKIAVLAARMTNAAPNLLIFKLIPLNGKDEMVAAGVAEARQIAVVLAAMRHGNKAAFQQ